MQSAFDNERARFLRGGDCFSIVSISSESSCALHARAFARLARTLPANTRRTDVVGWRDERLCVLMPMTSLTGTRDFVKRLITSDTALARFDIDVQTFPDAENDQGKGADEQTDAALPAAATSRAIRNDTGLASGAKVANGRFPRTPPALTAGSIDSERNVFWRKPPHWKRVLDVAGASVLLLAALPIMTIAAIHIKRSSPGPVLFKQERLGYLGSRFVMLKLRTMHASVSAHQHKAHLAQLRSNNATLEKLDARNDSRIIRGGRLLRKLGLDELPQLINVIRGDMSLVGPRPCLSYEAEMFDRWHHNRFDVRPGLTGLWQVSGKNATTFRTMMALDSKYAQRPCLIGDVSILLRTIPAILSQAQPIHETHRSDS